MKYYAAGQTSVDKTTFADGQVNGPYLGGTGIYGYGGIRVWTEDVSPVLNVASDFYDFYGTWIDENRVDRTHLNLAYDKTFFVDMVYQENGYYESIYTIQEKIDNAFLYGYTNCRLEQIARIAGPQAALYLYYEPINTVFWEKFREIRDASGLKVMWEPGFSVCDSGFREIFLKIMETFRPDMSTLNWFEASAMFGTKDEEELIRIIESFQVPFFFFRCGKRGAYALAGGKRFFVPSIDVEGYETVDPTGCGNASSAGAMYGWLETGNPVMAAVMGNISGGFNVGQFGIIPRFDEKMRQTAFAKASQVYSRLLAENPSWEKELEPFLRK
ncbi:MAG: PfkB family carbohydrate kinase [Candidatus Faecousia sp.]|nr:PfkB family carbohydrate kinase [Clostridiales bacterium]MDY6181620.1 PfkB family carbohydrate kinase [Candidatus Faecousia sp.]